MLFESVVLFQATLYSELCFQKVTYRYNTNINYIHKDKQIDRQKYPCCRNGFGDASSNPSTKGIQELKIICHVVDFVVPADLRVKAKEVEKIDKHLYLTRELKKLWNMKVMVITIIVEALGTVHNNPKRMNELEIRGRIVTT